MPESILSFANSSSFRNSLLAKNLEPYDVPGVYTPPSGPIAYEVEQSFSNVIDSPDNLITDGVFSNQLYPLNEYGPDGGYNLNITFNGPALPVASNSGEYDPTDTVLDLVNEFFIRNSSLTLHRTSTIALPIPKIFIYAFFVIIGFFLLG